MANVHTGTQRFVLDALTPRMNTLQRNIAANFAGRIWTALVGVAFIPLYIHFMGIEAYGLVGFFTTLQGLFMLLDLGLSTTLNRELARYAALPGKGTQMRDLVRTLETLYWGLALLIALIVLALSSFAAHEWINAQTLPETVVQQAVMLMGFVIAFQWPISFYGGGLIGLQRQVLYSGWLAVGATLRFAGAVLVLWLVSPTILAFFTWQIVISIITAGGLALALWRSLPVGTRASRFQPDLLRSVWRFAAGMSGISITVLVLTQIDKVILSKLLTLEMFGYYSLAAVVAGGISTLSIPLFTALFPGFSRLVALGDEEGLKRLYHRSCQLLSVAVIPVAVVVAAFAPEILLLWTANPTTVQNTHILVSLLMVGSALNGLLVLPYALELAYGWTSLPFYTNVVSIALLLPLLILLTPIYGAIAAAVIWVLLNLGYVLIQIQILHRRLLKGEQWRWYFEDIGLPLLAVLLVVGCGRLLISPMMPQFVAVPMLAIVAMTAFFASCLAAPEIRARFLGGVYNIRTKVAR
jgi:O-antigen/teichoic acid export membrane protein